MRRTEEGALTPSSKMPGKVCDMPSREDEPLPATLTFVLTMGGVFAVLWALMYLLLKARW